MSRPGCSFVLQRLSWEFDPKFTHEYIPHAAFPMQHLTSCFHAEAQFSMTLCPAVLPQCAYIMRMHMLNPLTTREFSAQKLEDSPDAPPDAAGENSERWLSLAVSFLTSVLMPIFRSQSVELHALGLVPQRQKYSILVDRGQLCWWAVAPRMAGDEPAAQHAMPQELHRSTLARKARAA